MYFLFQSSLGLLTGDIDDFNLFDGELLKEKASAPQITDHDYVMQPVRSPASSDSGVSVDSSGNSPRNTNDDLTQFCNDMIALSESPSSDMSHLSPQMISSEQSPASDLSNSPGVDTVSMDGLELENFDFSGIEDMNFGTVDPSAINAGDIDLLDENVSIDIGNGAIMQMSLR